MRSIQLHPLSLLTGFGVAALAFVAMSQSPQPTQPSPSSSRAVEFFARPRDFVQLDEGVAFVVPPQKVFVPTAIGARPPLLHSATWELVTLTVDDVVELSSWKAMIGSGNDPVGNGASMRNIPTGLAVPAGAVVEVRDSTPSQPDSRVWGYLADA